jgi:hypothetical protein
MRVAACESGNAKKKKKTICGGTGGRGESNPDYCVDKLFWQRFTAVHRAPRPFIFLLESRVLLIRI